MTSPAIAAPSAETGTGAGALTPRAERTIRLVSVGAAVVIAISALILSYAGLHELALAAGFPPGLAILLPVMMDGLQVAGSAGVLYSTLAGISTWYPWVLVMLGVAVSVGGNWVAAPDGFVSKSVHAASPLILALVLEELLRVTRHKARLQVSLAVDQSVFLARHSALEEERGTERISARVVGMNQQPSPKIHRAEGVKSAGGTTQPTAKGDAVDVLLQRETLAGATATALDQRGSGGRASQVSPVPAPVLQDIGGQARATGGPVVHARGTARQRITMLITEEPDLTSNPGEVYRRLRTDPSSTRKILREIIQSRELKVQDQQHATD